MAVTVDCSKTSKPMFPIVSGTFPVISIKTQTFFALNGLCSLQPADTPRFTGDAPMDLLVILVIYLFLFSERRRVPLSACAWRQAVGDRQREAAEQQLYEHRATAPLREGETETINLSRCVNVVRTMNLVDMVLIKLLLLLYCIRNTKGKHETSNSFSFEVFDNR